VFTKNPDSDERAGLIPVIGLEGAKSLIKMGWKDGRVEISGYISKPEIQKSTSDYIYLYVNRRWFYSKNIVNAIRDACGESLMKGKYPIAIIFISVPFEDVDVNVHPAKTEVRFVDERSIINSIAGAVRAAFARHREHEAILREVHEKGAQQTLAVESTGTAAQPAVVKEAITAYAVSHPAGIVEEKTKVKIRVIGQALNSYIIGEISQTSEAGEGAQPHLVIVDQHAACERIAYEALRNFEKVVKQELIVPLVVELTPKEAKTLEEYRELLASLGFEIEDFGLRTFTVRSVPSVASMIATKELFIEMLDALGEGKAQDAEEKIEHVLKTIACKSAIKSGETLSVEKMYEILSALYKCKLPFNCPHGRPTVLKYQKKDLDRMFLR
jgi:DNA mismatch repair protein MutL